MSIRVVFFGSPQFAVPSLQALTNDARCSVVMVVTQPDRRAGRGRELVAPPVKIAAESLGIPIWQPDTLRSEEAHEQLRATVADLFVVVAYGELFLRSTLSIPLHGCLNVHPSLLPHYRGSAPIQHAILNGDRETGVSIIQMARRLDAGPIVAQHRLMLDGSETGGSLGEMLADLAGAMLPDVVADWVADRIEAHPQDHARATYTRELTKADGEIDWSAKGDFIERQVRAYAPWPSAWTTLGGKRIVLERAERGEPSDRACGQAPGTLIAEQRDVFVVCGNGVLRLVDVRSEGKGIMSASAWFRGLRLSNQPRFGAPEAGSDPAR